MFYIAPLTLTCFTVLSVIYLSNVAEGKNHVADMILFNLLHTDDSPHMSHGRKMRFISSHSVVMSFYFHHHLGKKTGPHFYYFEVWM